MKLPLGYPLQPTDPDGYHIVQMEFHVISVTNDLDVIEASNPECINPLLFCAYKVALITKDVIRAQVAFGGLVVGDILPHWAYIATDGIQWWPLVARVMADERKLISEPAGKFRLEPAARWFAALGLLAKREWPVSFYGPYLSVIKKGIDEFVQRNY